jgi:hypothetical protein
LGGVLKISFFMFPEDAPRYFEGVNTAPIGAGTGATQSIGYGGELTIECEVRHVKGVRVGNLPDIGQS